MVVNHVYSGDVGRTSVTTPTSVPRSVYIHVPFCRHHCAYCNFTVIAGREDLMDRYLDSLAAEMESLERRRTVDTIYIGGGTPTELTPGKLQRLLNLLEHWFERAQDYEYTVEANPDGFSENCADMLVDRGINRVSLGIQSFDAGKLLRLDRRHSVTESFRAIELAQSRFGNLSIDLMFAAPGETLETWHSDLQTAVRLAPQHLSTYGLTFEKGTLFWNARDKGRLEEIDEAVQADMYELAIDKLRTAGYEHYEISNFARPCFRSRHNQAYWTGHGYWGFGPGAARFVDGCRELNHRSTSTYVRRLLTGQSPVEQSETLTPEESARERLVFGLRRLDGISVSEFENATGFNLQQLAGDAIGKFVTDGYLERDADRIRLSRKGLLISDSLWPELL